MTFWAIFAVDTILNCRKSPWKTAESRLCAHVPLITCRVAESHFVYVFEHLLPNKPRTGYRGAWWSFHEMENRVTKGWGRKSWRKSLVNKKDGQWNNNPQMLDRVWSYACLVTLMKLFFFARILHEIFPISRFKFLIMNVFFQSSFDILSITIKCYFIVSNWRAIFLLRYQQSNKMNSKKLSRKLNCLKEWQKKHCCFDVFSKNWS